MRGPFDVVRSGYDDIGERYRDWSAGSEVRRRWLDFVLAELPPGALVVDLGCGPGEPATRRLAERCRVIAVDGSAVQLGLARAAAPSAWLVQADMTRFGLRPGSVDAVASFYALGHVPAEQHAALFGSIGRWLRPGGLLVTSAPVGAGNTMDPSWLDVPMFFGGIGETGTQQAIADAGLDLLLLETVEEDEGGGHLVPFLWLMARKPDGAGPARRMRP